MTALAPFVHLHVHTEYSISDGLIRIDDLISRTRALQMPAVAVTDRANVFAFVKFYRAAQRAGLKPVLGADVLITQPGRADVMAPIVLLCRDRTGYLNLSRLLTRAYLDEGRRDQPRLLAEWLTADTLAGLIALSGGAGGAIATALLEGNAVQAGRQLDWWRQRMDDRFYLELTRTGRVHEPACNEALVTLADRCGVPLVATNDVRFMARADFEAHEARVCIQQGRTLADTRRPRPYSEQQYLRSPAEMVALFADLPDALANTIAIAERCSIEVDLSTYHLPEYPDAAGSGSDVLLRELATSGLKSRIESYPPVGADVAAYHARLDSELRVITQMGFAGYFLIVADFIRWAKAQDIPVGPGRGSGAGSLAAYALGITEVDPIQYDLLFERLLNPERVDMPDFDIDFCMDRRDEVIDYVVQRYGQDRVAQIITHGTMAAKAVVRDVGRVLGHPYGFVDQIAKLIPFELNMTLDRALAESPEFRQRYDEDEEVKAVIDLSLQLEGLTRNAGRHAGGVVISPRPLTEYTPLFCESGGGMPVTQFDMGDIGATGLVKFDFLGLRTLTIIQWAVRDIDIERRAAGLTPVDLNRLPMDDRKTFALIRQAATTAVFQFESRGMRDLIKRLQPDRFGDLIAAVALFRPGPMDLIPDFIERKHGRARVEYLHPLLEEILRPTYGVMVYQEQVMQIAQSVGGYTLGAADVLRRAMGKKKADEMAAERDKFVAGAQAHGVAGSVATRIFDLMEKFAGYGFNKSHSTAYALVAYQTAWLKAHYPAAFMAAVLSADMDSTDKVIGLIDECRRLAIRIEAPDVNLSQYRFTVCAVDSIRFGLGAIKGIGQSAIDAITDARTAHGPFRSLFEFCRRVDVRKLNRRAVEVLIKAGAFDAMQIPRQALGAAVEPALRAAEQHARQLAAGQGDMFGLASAASNDDRQTAPDPREGIPDIGEWSDDERLRFEKETLGFYLTGHPIERYRSELAQFVSCPLRDLKPGKRVVAGLIADVRLGRNRRGRVANVTIDDATARINITVYSENLESNINKLIVDTVMIVEGNCAEDSFNGENAVVAERILSMDEARQKYARGVLVTLDAPHPDLVATLQSTLAAFRPGQCPVIIDYRHNGAAARVVLGDAWRVRATEDLLGRLRGHFGPTRIAIEY